jgi:hypothetical protein
LKNRSKSQKKSNFVWLHMSRAIQWTYNMVCLNTKLLLWFFKDWAEINKKEKCKNFVIKHTILYIHCVALLMWSPTKLDFLFFEFSMIYYDFSKIRTK